MLQFSVRFLKVPVNKFVQRSIMHFVIQEEGRESVVDGNIIYPDGLHAYSLLNNTKKQLHRYNFKHLIYSRACPSSSLSVCPSVSFDVG